MDPFANLNPLSDDLSRLNIQFLIILYLNAGRINLNMDFDEFLAFNNKDIFFNELITVDKCFNIVMAEFLKAK